jgi:pheromone a factor receptor
MDPPTQPYTTAILLATFSLLSVLLITPPMFWHFTNRNIGATSLILWLLLLNLQTFLNALLWSHDDLSQWFGGNVLCDIEVKLMMAASVGVPSSVASVLRALARVMDTDKASLGLSKREKRRGYAIDLVWCVGCPVVQIFFHYVVQTERYYVVGIAGCTPAADDSWVTDLLILTPPVVWTVVGGYYSGEFDLPNFLGLLRVWLADLDSSSTQLSCSSACTATAATSPAC